MMVIKKINWKSGVAAVLALLLLLGMIPLHSAFLTKTEAHDITTLYFDTYVDSGWGDWNGWTKQPSVVYAYLTKQGGTTQTVPMTATGYTSVGGSDYRIFSCDCTDCVSVVFLSSESGGDPSCQNYRKTEAATISDSVNAFKLQGKQGNEYPLSTEGRSIDGFYFDATAPFPGANAIIPSAVGAGAKTFHDSKISNTENTGNVKANGHYLVGEYDYTGKYLTYKSDFFDYMSNEEVTGGWNNITDSTSSGYTDPYTTLNERIAAAGGTATFSTNSMKFFFRNPPNGSSNFRLYVWDGSYQPAGSFDNRPVLSSSDGGSTYSITLNNIENHSHYKAILTYTDKHGTEQRITFGEATTDGTPSYADKQFKTGYKYVVNLEKPNDLAEMRIASYSGGNEYTYPLYFGCFWLWNWNSYYLDSTKPDYRNFFWPANLSIRNDRADDGTDTSNDYKLSASVKGLVNSQMKDGAVADVNNADLKLPYFDKNWISNNRDVARYWENIDFPFYEIRLDKDMNGNTVRDNENNKPVYYQFNSRDVTSLYLNVNADINSGEKKLYEHPNAIMSQDAVVGGPTKGFFPFNRTGSDNGKNNDLAFGVKYTIPFVLTEDGKIKGVDTTFEFMGDDDVWVFVDDKMFLDMGGGHKDAYGKIDFALDKQEVYLRCSADMANSTTLEAASQSLNGSNKGASTTKFTFDNSYYTTDEYGNKIYDSTKVHTLTMFFMERGMWESDNFIRFNFIKQNILNVKNNLDISNINAGFRNKTYIAANYDVFDYTLNNTDIEERLEEEGSNGLKYPGGRISSATRIVTDDEAAAIGRTTTKLNAASAGSTTGNFDWHTEGAVKNTLFERYDDYFTETSESDKFVTGKTSADGGFDLLYGQKASFKYQFFSDSTMELVQNNALKQQPKTTLTNQNTLESKISDSSRRVGDLYKTKWVLTDIDGVVLGQEDTFATRPDAHVTDNRIVTDDEKFVFQNSEAKATIGVNLTATFTNQPNVGGLRITKELSDSTEQYNGSFTIKVRFTDVFGQSGVDLEETDYSSIPYTIVGQTGTKTMGYSNGYGTITLKKGETAVIEDIPVQTKVEITEDEHEFHRLKTITNATPTITLTDSESTVTNERKTGTLTVTKTITGTGADLSKTFPVTVTLTAPDGVTLGNYITNETNNVQSRTNITDLRISANTFSFNVTNGSSITFRNIPYGTVYNVEETADAAYNTAYTYSDTVKIINDDTGNPAGSRTGPADTVGITNTKIPPATTSIVITKVSSYGTKVPITGAEFALYDTAAHAQAKGRDGKITPTVDGAVYTFSDLELNTKYYLVELSPPPGFTLKNEITEITTNGDDTPKTMTIENDPIPINMPETGGVPFTVNLTFLGILAMSLAGTALIIYKRKLQKAAVNTDEKGRHED